MILLALLVQAAAPPAPVAAPTPAARLDACIDSATRNPAAGVREALAWSLAGGGVSAQQCLGIANANADNFVAAANAFEGAARGAEVAKDPRAATLWAQAGNAWLAAGDAAKARATLDAALAAGTITGLPLGEAYLDRARAHVAAGTLPAARGDIDRALQTAKDDPLAWLLSATLARRMDDLPRARTDIAEALRHSSDDASVQLEAGNIAARDGDALGARGYWQKAVQIGGTTPVATAARTALAQFDAGK